MNLSRIDRNRLVAVTLLTVFTVPFIWMAAGSHDDVSTQTTAVVTTTTFATGIGTDIESDAPANLEGPSGGETGGGGQIAYPADNNGNMARGLASFKRFPNDAKTACVTALAPLGAEVTIRNLDNGRKIVCTNVNLGYIPGNADITLHTSLFEKIANLIDAPLPVEITW